MGFQTDMNPFGEIISHEQKDIGSITWAESFGYDGLGNIESINQNGEISTYQYDDLNRIIQEDVVEGIQTYTYDEKGNRKTMEGTMKLPLGPREFTYNALNQLSTFKENDEVTTYQYYVGGLRATKESQDGDFTRYIYFQGNVIEELDQEGNPTARNIWGNQLLYREDMTSSLGGYYFYNGHGDVVKVIAADGSKDVLKEYDYDIWGNVLTETSHETKTFDNPFQYTGEIYDEESGLIYLRTRYYDSSMGRFITEDTYEGEINNPLSLNLYTYVYNNPLRYTDPSGHIGLDGAGIYGQGGTYSNGPLIDFQYIAAQHTSVESALGYWTLGGSDPFFTFYETSQEAPFSAEYFMAYTEIGVVVFTGGYGATTKQATNVVVKGTNNLGKLSQIGDNVFESSAGLIYGSDPKFGNRIGHVLAHGVADPSRPNHTVFNVGSDNILGLLDEAWLMRGDPLKDDAAVYLIDVGRVIGTNGETTIRLVIKPNTTEVITAYPTK
ncbi:RHS repeat domain-containing protein [Chengkuizengella marina]|uniref:RHS repeat-associated core domain-containing protein n=1 Tax=Chengkuizengella marina TaxID=2507566 RepID=A0A6N9Q790_9BACL|nr:RHS repeat-associated core domain-containing protein [Chengkuizengella marina]NBI30727.1 RHS repeat-associated core domain-containing protein [Chengkuizengella marina]